MATLGSSGSIVSKDLIGVLVSNASVVSVASYAESYQLSPVSVSVCCSPQPEPSV